MYYMITGTGIA